MVTPECLERVRDLMSGQVLLPRSWLDPVKLVITDVDGVLTGGSIYYDATGECLKRFKVRDGLGISLLEESGIRMAILSGRDSATLRNVSLTWGWHYTSSGSRTRQRPAAS